MARPMADEQKPAEEKPKIVVDEDWKAQAEKEREELARQQAEGAKGGEAAGQRPAGRRRELPPPNFATHISTVTSQILYALGAIADASGRRYRDMAYAKHQIDTLAMLEEKTKGNLTDEEKRLLDDALYQVRMAYVQAAGGGVG